MKCVNSLTHVVYGGGKMFFFVFVFVFFVVVGADRINER